MTRKKKITKKKSKKDDTEDIEIIVNDVIETETDNEEEKDDVESSSDIEIIIEDDDIKIDIVIEVDEDDLDFDIKPEEVDDGKKSDEVTDEEITLSKHSIQGKHSLKYDSIFKGKKDENSDNPDYTIGHFNESFEVDKSSNYWFESIDNENYVKDKRVGEKVYEVLSKHTDLNFLNNRRKPSKIDFNQYYFLLNTHLKNENFTNIELFNELAVYFSDNLFNMFKLLDNKWRNMIISELQEHIGKQASSREIKNRNIYEGTEIEFEWIDIDNKIKLITGVVMETNYELSEFKVNSYENNYNINIKNITKILNNTKFKYNLNKLNNIDFL